MERDTKTYVILFYKAFFIILMEVFMNTLYIDTHSEKIIFVLFQNGHLKKILQQYAVQHSSLIMPLLEQLLNEFHLTTKDLSDIIVVNGPGSFTGVRLGVTVAKTLAYTLNIPIRVLSSIQIKAISNLEKGHHWFVETEKNGYFVGEFNDLDELLQDYFYIKKMDYADFKLNRDIIEDVDLDYQRIYDYSCTLPFMNPHSVNPLYVKQIEVLR